MHDVVACTPRGYVSNGRSPTPAHTLVFFAWKVSTHTRSAVIMGIYGNGVFITQMVGYSYVFYCFENVLKKTLIFSEVDYSVIACMSTGDVQVCHQSPMGFHCTMGVINLGFTVHTGVKTAASWFANLMQPSQLVLTTNERLTK